jgi:mannitol-1-phosphate 5-dehydrogenase
LCLSQGVFPDKIATVCAAALRYEDPDDRDAQRLQQMIRERGIERTITEVTGLDRESVLARTIAVRYRELGKE